MTVAQLHVLGPGAGPAAYEVAVAAALTADGSDAAMVVYAAALAPEPEAVAASVAAGAATVPSKAVVASFPGHDLGGALVGPGGLRIPELGFPDAAARALGAAVRYGRWRSRPEGAVPELDGLDLDAVDDVLGTTGRLRPEAAARLLGAIGVDVAAVIEAVGPDAAGAAGAAVGFPVALKAIGRGRGAKIEASGVALDLHSSEAVAASYGRMAASLGSAMTGVAVQAMVGPGTDVRVTLEPAPVVGAALGLGVGGALDPPAPVAHAVLPLTDVAAIDLVARAGLADRLGPEGTAAVIDLLHRLAHLAEERPAVVHVELNPVIVAGRRARSTDVVVEVGQPRDALPEHLRRLG